MNNSRIQLEANSQMFAFRETQVRTFMDGDEPWFCLMDVGKALGIADTSSFLRSRRCDEKGVCYARTLTRGGEQNITFINEGNLYTLIARSDRDEAIEFQRWVNHEVLPTLRRTGHYGNHPVTTPELLSEIRREQMALVARIELLETRALPSGATPGLAGRKVLNRLVNRLASSWLIPYPDAWTRVLNDFDLQLGQDTIEESRRTGYRRLECIEHRGDLAALQAFIEGLLP